jgi:hypothetical protein
VLRATGQHEHDSHLVVAPYGKSVGTVHYSSFSHKWHARVGPDATPCVTDILTAGQHAVWLRDFDTEQGTAELFAPFGHATREIPDALTELLAQRQDIHNAAARAYTVQYGRQPQLHLLDEVFSELADRGCARLTIRGAGELADALESLRAPAAAWRAELVEAGASEAREWLVFPLVRLLRDSRRLPARIRATITEVRRRAAERDQQTAE